MTESTDTTSFNVPLTIFEGDSPELAAAEAFRAMTEICGSASASKGWHDDRPTDEAQLGHWRGNKLMLMVSELVEAHDELRNGKAPNETYYITPDTPQSLVAEVGDVEKARELFEDYLKDKPKKPEGVPSELADTVIRIFDFCYTEGIDLGAIIEEKLTYNKTREKMHGGKKF